MNLTTLRGTGLTQHLACPTLTDDLTAQGLPCLGDRSSSLRRAQKFGRDASRRIALSNSASATNFLRREFSLSNSLSRLAWSIRKPPYSFLQR